MKSPGWTRPGAFGAAIGVVAITILVFTWCGWTTGGSAKAMAKDFAAEKVTMVVVPVCLNMSANDPDCIAKLATVQGTTGFDRREAMLSTG